MSRLQKPLCGLAFSQLWPLALATPIFVLPILYLYLTFQCHWHDCGALLNIINNLFDLGYFHSFDWSRDHFNVHFTPFFYLLSPFVYLSRGLFFYLILHALAFAGNAWVYHKYAEQLLGPGSLAVLVYLSLIANPYFMAANLYPHFEAFMSLSLMAFAFFALRGRFWLAILCLLVALSVKEDVWIYGIAASSLLLGRITVRHLAAYLLTSVAYYVLILQGIYPALYPDAVHYFLQLWAYGHSTGEVLRYLVTHPRDTGTRLITGSGLDFNLIYLFLPLLAGWRFVPAAAVLYLWVNSTDINRSHLAFYYNLPSVTLYAMTLPFALINLEHLCHWLRQRSPHMMQARRAAQMMLCALVAINVGSQIHPPLSLTQNPSLVSVLARELNLRHFLQIHRMISHVLADREKSVLASFTIAAYIPPRHTLGILANSTAAYVMNDLWRPDYVVFNFNQNEPLMNVDTSRQFFTYMQTSPDYHKVEDVENVVIFVKSKQ
jgi:uncharacterized membrane protein